MHFDVSQLSIFPLNRTARWNMPCRSIALPTFQLFRSWLKAQQSLNMKGKSVPAATFQSFNGWLNTWQCSNMLLKFVHAATFHLSKGWFSAQQFWNICRSSVAFDTSQLLTFLLKA